MPIPAASSPHDGVDYVELEETPLAVVRATGVTMDEIRGIFDSAFGALGAAIGEGAISPAGPGLAVYHGDPADTFDLEVGFPIAGPLIAPITMQDTVIEPGSIPGQRVAAASHLGGYDGLGAAWERIISGATEDGHQPSGVLIEVYVVDPSNSSEEDLRTDLYFPVGS